ncbi:acetyl-CoA hydrolase/transferase C-terminal domain-containing protein [Paracoccus onubensis]|uniref:acetyl-CoA hydrolase/transferase family protein n=1 Tax=Paracoccus onubensis TaxID=1675788 RepID=UPI0027308A97|nr:acetyl-CoA hydrolase/transferase C-terminal domain-containing protein [Paracoccus onubensis]MDP0929645.1 acetyl-CoA hydrolase/transferase C-terminal domain-containing protein [Paracoccus onubensis]
MPENAEPVDAASLDLAEFLKPGDHVLIAQGAGEPLTLSRLAALAARTVPDLTFCVGTMISDSLQACGDNASFESYGRMGELAALPRDKVRIFPGHYSEYTRNLHSGKMKADVVLIQLSLPDKCGRPCLGMGDLYLFDVARRARLVIAEINPATPRVPGTGWPDDIPIHLRVAAAAAPPSLPSGQPGPRETCIAALVARLIPDRAVLQLGIGKLPLAIIRALKGHRDLGLHSGALPDGIPELMECDALTNSFKETDTGRSVTSMIMGGPGVWAWADGNDDIAICRTDYTHDGRVIAGLSRFTAINSAVEVDLLGQINSERAGNGGPIIGGIGGQLDFTRGAQMSEGGRAIIALPATTSRMTVSRIVPRVAEVTISKADADTIVTEYGIAELRGQAIDERARRMIAIAAPEFRDELSREWHDRGRHLYG